MEQRATGGKSTRHWDLTSRFTLWLDTRRKDSEDIIRSCPLSCALASDWSTVTSPPLNLHLAASQ